jgi:hypothetical protein
MLISIHMPKTAGSSFRATLEGHYCDAFRPDYGDYPLAHSPDERRAAAHRHAEAMRATELAGVACIHGHLLPAKYLPLAADPGCQFVTWLREPVARLVSHYAYWQASYDRASDSTSSLHRRVVEEGWTLEQFCLAPQLRNVYSEFLWGFPHERLNFVGITEYFEEDLRYFSTHFLGLNATPRRLNERLASADDSVSPQLARLDLVKIRQFHAEDVALYEQELARRCARETQIS